MDLTNKNDLRAALALAHLSPTKKLGQHFLIDKSALDRIVASANLAKSDKVLEIGPGVGTLTQALLEQAGSITVVERDTRFIEILHRQFPSVTVIEADFLDFDLDSLGKYKVVANLPYYITSKIIQKLLTATNKPTSITILVQKEVAMRIVAGPGAMSLLAISVQYYARPQLVEVVPAASFWPAPEVDSAILQIDAIGQLAFKAEEKRLFRLVKAGFGERRKMLKNALSGGLNITPAQAAMLIESANLAANVRAQEMSLDDWHRLFEITRGHLII